MKNGKRNIPKLEEYFDVYMVPEIAKPIFKPRYYL